MYRYEILNSLGCEVGQETARDERQAIAQYAVLHNLSSSFLYSLGYSAKYFNWIVRDEDEK